MHENINGLKALCSGDLTDLTPFQIRTRFERHLYGVLVECSDETFGEHPTGLTRSHMEQFIQRVEQDNRWAIPTRAWCVSAFDLISDVFERFTQLCDTSNWSDDGQDPRINACRDDIFRLCECVTRKRVDKSRM